MSRATRSTPSVRVTGPTPVDYRNGTVHIRTEVIEKPAGGEPTTWSLCYIPNRGRGNGYGCTGTVVYREKGVYEQDVSMKSFWQNDAIVWTDGIKQMDLVIKDNSGGQGHAHKRKDSEKFFPTKVRITMVQVSAGSKYDPSLVPNLPREKAADGNRQQDGEAKSAQPTSPNRAQSLTRLGSQFGGSRQRRPALSSAFADPARTFLRRTKDELQ